MRTTHVSDGLTIISTQGVRFVEKIDQSTFAQPPTPPMKFRLKVTYKGGELDYLYPDQATRDAQYDALKAALTPATQGEPKR